MKTYVIKKADNANLRIDANEWMTANNGNIDQYPWKKQGEFCPDTAFYLLYDDKGIGVKFVSNETDLITETKNMNDENIWCDSCVELFFNPNPAETNKYLSFELSVTGCMLLSLGKDRYNREFFEGDFSQFNIETKVEKDGWSARYFIPYEFIKKYYSGVSKNMEGNLQKCCGNPKKFHTGSWNLIGSREPDFHLSEYFGEISIEG